MPPLAVVVAMATLLLVVATATPLLLLGQTATQAGVLSAPDAPTELLKNDMSKLQSKMRNANLGNSVNALIGSPGMLNSAPSIAMSYSCITEQLSW
ncbi:UNVERIFIED_CONTAM: hypothetical protein FKN15_031406 [Acipenser sinensis]